MDLKILQIGGGSMGSRRMRLLSTKPGVHLALFDERPDRRERAAALYRAETFATLEAALNWKPDALVISTPPDHHARFVEIARTHQLPHFVEAGLRVEKEHLIAFRNHQIPVAAPSCTFHFLPIFRRLQEYLSEAVGSLHSYQLLLSCNLPAWHPDERGDFYAYRRETGAAREMVPFELYWLNRLFSEPTHAIASILRRGTLPTDAWDSYISQFRLANGAVGQLSVLMASPVRFRRGVAVGDHGAVAFDVLTGSIEKFCPKGKSRERLETGHIEEVMEAAYDAESSCFYDALTRQSFWPHSYESAAAICGALGAMERSVQSGLWEPVENGGQPDFL